MWNWTLKSDIVAYANSIICIATRDESSLPITIEFPLVNINNKFPVIPIYTTLHTRYDLPPTYHSLPKWSCNLQSKWPHRIFSTYSSIEIFISLAHQPLVVDGWVSCAFQFNLLTNCSVMLLYYLLFKCYWVSEW